MDSFAVRNVEEGVRLGSGFVNRRVLPHPNSDMHHDRQSYIVQQINQSGPWVIKSGFAATFSKGQPNDWKVYVLPIVFSTCESACKTLAMFRRQHYDLPTEGGL